MHRRRNLRLGVALTCLCAPVLFFLALGAEEHRSRERAPGGRGERVIARGDCLFLERPEEFLEARRLRQERAGQITYRLAARLPGHDDPGPPAPRNLVDYHTYAKMQRDGIRPARLSSDAEFLRRATLDLTGRIPSADDVRAFLGNYSPDKRDRLVETLIGSPEFVDRWTMFFGDHLKNAILTNGSNRYYEGRNAFYQYIRDSVAANKPYDVFAREMLTAGGDSFTSGKVNYLAGMIAAMGPAQDTWDLMWVNTATQFLGVETYDCLFCHDGRGHLEQLNLWGARGTRMEAWKLSAFFSRTRLRRQRGEAGTNQPYLLDDRADGLYALNTTSGNRTPRQPLEGLSAVAPEYVLNPKGPAPVSAGFRETLAQAVTSDPQFARATVNYIWAELMGLGIVDPPSAFDLARQDPRNPPPEPWSVQPSHPELLEALALEFVNSGFDVRHVIRLIVNSATYQFSARYDGDWNETYAPYFARRLVRRLSAEEVHDAIVKATGVPARYTVRGFDQPIRWAMQLPDTNEPGRGGVFLNTFLRGNRDGLERSGEASILQNLAMLNDGFVIERLRASPESGANPNLARRLLAASLTERQIVEELFLTVLNRRPLWYEEAAAVAHFSGRSRQQAVEDLLWVLLNKVDFVYNY